MHKRQLIRIGGGLHSYADLRSTSTAGACAARASMVTPKYHRPFHVFLRNRSGFKCGGGATGSAGFAGFKREDIRTAWCLLFKSEIRGCKSPGVPALDGLSLHMTSAFTCAHKQRCSPEKDVLFTCAHKQKCSDPDLPTRASSHPRTCAYVCVCERARARVCVCACA